MQQLPMLQQIRSCLDFGMSQRHGKPKSDQMMSRIFFQEYTIKGTTPNSICICIFPSCRALLSAPKKNWSASAYGHQYRTPPLVARGKMAQETSSQIPDGPSQQTARTSPESTFNVLPLDKLTRNHLSLEDYIHSG